MSEGHAADLPAIRAAADRIAPHVHHTPVLTSSSIDAVADHSLFFKCENLQKVGAFKMRGATNAVFSLPDEQAQRGVATHSSGNFAQALALAARLHSIPAHVVMPTSAPAVKRDAVEAYGATIYPCEPTLPARESTAAAVVERTGATLLHPYNHPDVIAGQGTVALELLDQVPDLDAIVAPVGGGGLMSGICVAARALKPEITLLAAEPAGADDAARSLASGRLIPQTAPNTVADGLLTSLGSLTWPILRDHLDGILTVRDDQIVAAMRLVWQRMKLVIEPSAAVPLAAVLDERFATALEEGKGAAGKRVRPNHVWGGRVGVVLSGGNVDLDHLPW